MTNRKRAHKWVTEHGGGANGTARGEVRELSALLDEVAAEARAEEREACAKECERFVQAEAYQPETDADHVHKWTRFAFANRIRSRK